MKCYLIWDIELAAEIDTTDRDRYVESRPNAAQYLPFYLFPESYSAVARLSCEVVDLTVYTLVETEEDKILPTDLTKAEFLAMCDAMIAAEHTGKCIVLSVAQGKYLHKERYSAPEEVV